MNDYNDDDFTKFFIELNGKLIEINSLVLDFILKYIKDITFVGDEDNES